MRALYLGCFPWGVGAGTVPSHTLRSPGEGDVALMASTESNRHLGRAGDVFFWGRRRTSWCIRPAAPPQSSALGPTGRAEGRGPTGPPVSRPARDHPHPCCPLMPVLYTTFLSFLWWFPDIQCPRAGAGPCGSSESPTEAMGRKEIPSCSHMHSMHVHMYAVSSWLHPAPCPP